MDLAAARSGDAAAVARERSRFMRAIQPILQHDGPKLLVTDSQVGTGLLFIPARLRFFYKPLQLLYILEVGITAISLTCAGRSAFNSPVDRQSHWSQLHSHAMVAEPYCHMH